MMSVFFLLLSYLEPLYAILESIYDYIENITRLRRNMKFISSVNKISVLFYKQQKKIYMESMYLFIIIRGF